MTGNAIAKGIVDAAIRLHTRLGSSCGIGFTMPCSLMNLLSVTVIYGTIRSDIRFRDNLIVADRGSSRSSRSRPSRRFTKSSVSHVCGWPTSDLACRSASMQRSAKTPFPVSSGGCNKNLTQRSQSRKDAQEQSVNMRNSTGEQCRRPACLVATTCAEWPTSRPKPECRPIHRSAIIV